jgi:hypothetical protein
MRHGPREEFFYRDAIAANQQAALRFERCGERGNAGVSLWCASALHLDRDQPTA